MLVIPAKAGIQRLYGLSRRNRHWIPAFAGMTSGIGTRTRMSSRRLAAFRAIDKEGRRSAVTIASHPRGNPSEFTS
ncbi:MAG: hypothetical protein EPN68_12530 [Rhodanobacter sp.]|nr:MAG: hypothetical protein EPN68_12530 [Rhodanobacter sp.]